ncbi:MAG: DNA polymerase III subunit alpha [Bacillota bacterium]
MRQFVHLHVHSEFSLLDGAARLKGLAEKAAALGLPAMAVTDHGVMYGVVEFYKACRAVGVKPIIGCEVYVARRTRHDRTPRVDDDSFHLTLLAANEEGYRNLVRLCSLGHLEGFYYKPRVDRELLAAHNRGLIALSGCLAGEVAELLARGDVGGAREAAAGYRDIFGPESFFIELQDQGLEGQRALNAGLIALARELGLGLVATNDVHYIDRRDARAHDIVLCIQTLKSINDPDRLRFGSDEFYLKSAEEMWALFGEVPESLTSTLAISERCDFEFEFGLTRLPKAVVPEGYDNQSFFEKLCWDGLHRRYPAPSEEARRRLAHEMEIIRNLGFTDYFLIVWDFIDFAHREKIPVGPGRGSVTGSLVSYCLGITNIDPLRHNLIFERFLNPHRAEFPDIDIDFCDRKRDRVIDYVVGRYGEDRVAQIITFGTMAARAAIRDVGRALEMTFGEVDRIAKMVPFGPGVTLERALEMAPEFREAASSDPRVAQLLELARIIEGLPRHASVHAAGVVIAAEPLIDIIPLQRTPEGAVVTQFPMDTLSALGLLKMDFLGLRTLNVIEEAVKAVERSRGEVIDIDAIPLDDPAVFEMLCRGDTAGVFQFETSGMTDLLRRLRPETFGDLVASVALFRPGPMAMRDDFIDGRHGRKRVEYPHPALEGVLGETYGVMVYQEQVIQVASLLAGFSMGEADLLRVAFKKKSPEVMAAQREKFVAGAEANGVAPDVANKVFDLIERFAGYGFNKSHSAPYALVAYQTAWLKAHYPVEFMAASLTSVMGSSDRVAYYIDECRRMGIEVLPPDVNESRAEFTVSGGKIRFGLSAVKNLGEAAIEAIEAVREQGGPFRSLYDFCRRVDLRFLNKRAIESLIKAGAFDSLGGTRGQYLLALDRDLEAAQRAQKIEREGQLSLFAGPGGGGEEVQPPLPPCDPVPQASLLAMEKEALGFYVSGHPLVQYQARLAGAGTVASANLGDRREDERVTIGGMITGTKKIITKNGSLMLFATIEDLTGPVEVIVFPRTYERYAGLLHEDAVVLVRGRVSYKDEEPKVLADEIETLETEKTTRVNVDIPPEFETQETLERLRAIFELNQGSSPVYLRFRSCGRQLLTDRQCWIEPEPDVLEAITDLLGPGTVEVVIT